MSGSVTVVTATPAVTQVSLADADGWAWDEDGSLTEAVSRELQEERWRQRRHGRQAAELEDEEVAGDHRGATDVATTAWSRSLRMRLEAERYQVVKYLLHLLDEACHPDTGAEDRLQALDQIGEVLSELRVDRRQRFVRHAMEMGVTNVLVHLIEAGSPELVVAASNFFADIVFFNDVAARDVVKFFDRIAMHLQRHLATLPGHRPLQNAAVLLCMNVAAMYTSSHRLVTPLVRPVFLPIIMEAGAPDGLRGNAITLLANLAVTEGAELRSLGVAKPLLDLLLKEEVGDTCKSVAESVIIYLHGSRRSEEVDCLIANGVIGDYCVPLMESTLRGLQFRGMCPFLVYSARVFHALAQSRDYAEALVAHPEVLLLMMRASLEEDPDERSLRGRLASDVEGRCLALQVLSSFAHWGLWPEARQAARHLEPGGRIGCGSDCKLPARALPGGKDGASGGECAPPHSEDAIFVASQLPRLLADEHLGIRSAAAALWAQLHLRSVLQVLLVGHRLELDSRLPPGFWRECVCSYLFPPPLGHA